MSNTTSESSALMSEDNTDLSSPKKLVLFHQFRSHFNEWVFGPIDRLICSRDALIGFIFMTCAIDYLAGFLFGESTEGHVKKAFTGFIDKHFLPGIYDADELYDSLRNGLVHMFTIKNKTYALIHNHPEVHLKNSLAGKIILNASNFRDDLVSAANRYFNDVETKLDFLDKWHTRFDRDGFLYSSAIEVTSQQTKN